MSIVKLIISHTVNRSHSLVATLVEMFSYLYRFEEFRNMMNVLLSQMETGRAAFKIGVKRLTENLYGVCETEHMYLYNVILEKFVRKKFHTILIKEMNYATMIHEIAHSVDHGLPFNTDEFAEVLLQEVKINTSQSTRKAIDKIIVEPLKLYDKKHHTAEIFARYFELISLSKQVTSSVSNPYRYLIEDVHKSLPNSRKWILEIFNTEAESFVLSSIADLSKEIPMDGNSRSTKWSETTYKEGQKKPSKWSKRVGSMFE